MLVLLVMIGRIPWFDPAGGVAVGILIAKTGFDLMSGNYYNLMDRQDLNENKEMIEHCIYFVTSLRCSERTRN